MVEDLRPEVSGSAVLSLPSVCPLPGPLTVKLCSLDTPITLSECGRYLLLDPVAKPNPQQRRRRFSSSSISRCPPPRQNRRPISHRPLKFGGRIQKWRASPRLRSFVYIHKTTMC